MSSLSTLLVACIIVAPATGFSAFPASRVLRTAPVTRATENEGSRAVRSLNQAAGQFLAATFAVGMLASPVFAATEVMSEVCADLRLV